MTKNIYPKTINALVAAVALCGGLAFATGGAACSDSNSNNNSDAAARTGGAGGGSTTGSGGAGGVATQTTVHLTGAAEVPATTSPGSGDITVTWDAATRQVSVSGAFEGMSSNATVAHLHGPASAAATAPPLFPLTISTPLAASGMVSGNGTLSVANWAAFLAGQIYVNIHSTVNPNGEIRGQVTP